MKKIVLILCFLIFMVGVSFAQELDEKIPLLDEPIITPEQEIPTQETNLPQKSEKEESIGKDEPIPIKEESENANLLEVGSSTNESEEGTVPLQMATSTTEPSTGTLTPEATTIDLGTFTSEEGNVTLQMATSTTELPSGTSTLEDTTMEVGASTFAEGTVPTHSVATLTTTPLVGTLTPGTTTVDVGSATSKEIGTLSTTGLILIPTAYRRDDKRGFNTDFIIAYYIGDLWHSMNGGEFFDPIKFLFLSGDFKFSLFKEKQQIPQLGVGYEWFLVLQGGASTPAQMGGEFSGKSDRFGYPYLILSKKFKHLTCHLGMMSGEFHNLFNSLSDEVSVDSNKALIFGIDTKLFNRQINIEAISPLGSEFHLFVNTSIERFVGFDLSFMKSPEGLSIIGYFGIRLTLFPHIKDKK